MNIRIPKASFSSLYRFSMGALRFLSIWVGVLLGALVSVELWVENRRLANAAANYMPDMDPGVVLVLALLFTIPVLVIIQAVELSRCWALGYEPLALPSSVVLGVLAAWPIGCSFGIADISPRYSLSLFASFLSVMVFYLVRWLWLKNRARRLGLNG